MPPPKNAAGIATFRFGAAGVGDEEDDVAEGLRPGGRDRRTMGMSPVSLSSAAMSESSCAAKAAAAARVMTVSPTVTYLAEVGADDGMLLLRGLPILEGVPLAIVDGGWDVSVAAL